MRIASRCVLVALSASTLVSCFDASSPSGPRGASRALLAIAPQFDASASRTSAVLTQSGLAFDQVRIVILRPQTDTLKDTTLAFHPGDAARTLELAILASPNEQLTATVAFSAGATVLFEGSGSVVAVPVSGNDIAAVATEIAVSYTGPGATATRVVVAPGSGVYTANGPTQFTAAAFDVANAALLTAPFVWSVSDESVASISATGEVTPKVSRGTVRVRALTANGVGDSVTVTFAPVATRLRVVQGAAQTGAASSTLAIPVIIEADASDELPAPVAGVTVTFTALNGGSISPSTVTFDANGRAQALVTLGPTAGFTYLYSAVAGGFAVTFAEIAAAGTPTQLLPSGATTFSLPVGTTPDPRPSLRVADANGNSVVGVPLLVTLSRSGVVIKSGVVPSDTAGTIPVGVELPTEAGVYTLRIESPATPATFAPITYTITLLAGAPARLAFSAVPTGVKSGTLLPAPITVLIQDTYGNTVTTATNAVTMVLDPSILTLDLSFGGTKTVAAAGGVATFSDLSFTTLLGIGVRLVAQSPGLASATSATFTIIP